ncbi:hypothetical protein [Sphingomonas elodea]|uniref:hypothetical protein n=1 Tax=Sphingomonas elodea TaxID=179878 RepID=UPI001110EAC3|nr:hypothetical protein [Sphingomonas elodea]
MNEQATIARAGADGSFVAKGAMQSTPSRAPLAGGFLLTASILVGAVAGALRGQATAGLLAGLAVGFALTLAVWLIDRARG